jgi:GDP-D-mannose dehydratase
MNVLGWRPRVKFRDLVIEMVVADLAKAMKK